MPKRIWLVAVLSLSTVGVRAQNVFVPPAPPKAAPEAVRAGKAGARPTAAAATSRVRIEVYAYSDGGFTFWEPSHDLNVRARKIWPDDFDFDLTGRADKQDFSGNARSKFMRDPSWGYQLSGRGFDAALDKFGDGWILSGSLDQSGTGRQYFNYLIDRDFPRNNFRVWEQGLDLRIETTSFNSIIDGTIDPALVPSRILALLATAAGLINQPKLRQDPRRP